MVTRLVPAIYERYWRPALGRRVQGRHRSRDGGGDPDRAPAARPRRGRHRPRRRLRPGQLLARVRPRGRPGAGSPSASTPRGRCSSAGRRGTAARRAPEPGRWSAATRPRCRFATRSFDAACCFAALHLFADPFAALDEMRRVLRPGGRIALMTSVRRQLTLRPLKPRARARQRDADVRGRRDRRALSSSAASPASTGGSPAWSSSSAGGSRPMR